MSDQSSADKKLANTRLVRTKGGGMVHKRGCSYASRGVPWRWAEGKSRDRILLDTQGLGYGFCKRCQPLIGLDEGES